MNNGFRVRRHLRPFLPALLWAAAVWYIGGLESTPSVPRGLGLDKVAHFAMYGVLGYLVGRGWSATGRRASWVLPLMVPLMLGAADEARQHSRPGRSGDVADWVADVAGASAGLYLALRRSRRQRLDEQA